MNVSGSKRTRYMECITMKITEDIIYVGVNDHDVDLFEGQYIVPNGMAYNSYVIRDEKIAVMDTVDGRFAEEWLANIEKALDGAAYGAGPCSKYSGVCRKISKCPDCWQCKDIYHDEKLFPWVRAGWKNRRGKKW